MIDFILTFVLCLWSFSYGLSVENQTWLTAPDRPTYWKALKESVRYLPNVLYGLLKETWDGIRRSVS